MKIVFFRHSLLSRGGDKMIAIHASHLAAQGHEVVIKTHLHRSVFAMNPRVRVEMLRVPGKLGTLLSAAFSRHDCDRLVADIIPLIPLLALRNRKKLVYFAQDYDETYYTLYLQKIFVRFLYFLSLALLRVRAIAVSEPLAVLLRRRFRARVVVSENGVDAAAFHYDPEPELVSAKQGRKAIVMLSRSDFRKGFDIALQAAEVLAGRCPDRFEIWTVGEDAKDKFPGLKHRDFGYLQEDRLRRILSSADLFLYPTRHEGFPLMVLEAFACRCPVVTTDAVPYAAHEQNALLFRKGDPSGAVDALLRLEKDQSLRKSIVTRGETLAARYTLSRALTVFAGVLAGPEAPDAR